MSLRRRNLMLATAALPLVDRALARPALAQNRRAATLRLVPSTDLVSLDPVFSTALVAVQHGYHVFDTLYGVDSAMRPQPQMAEGATISDDGRIWSIRLREGLLFHDGTPVRSADCAASLERWSRRDTFGRAYGAAVERYDTSDSRVLRIHLKRPFPRLLDAIGKPHSAPAFIMPERLARSAPDQPVTEMIGSGPYRFLPDELDSGNLIAYTRFDGYKPRAGNPEWTSGGKVAHFERVEWRVIADKATSVAALQQGEVDWVENLPADLEPLVARNRQVKVENADPLGTELVLRFNHSVAPFNNPELRRFVMAVVQQVDYLATVTGGKSEDWRECKAMFPCTIPGIEELGRQKFGALASNPARMAEALKATGYGGEKVVVINAADSAAIAPLGLVTAERLRQAGLNVDLQDMDWGTLLQRRLSKAPVDQGGWGIYHSTWPSIAIANPVLNTTVRGEGERGWPGWYESAEMERLTADWLAVEDDAGRDRLTHEAHALALRDVPSLPLGIYFPKTAYRADLQGVLGGSVRYPWNVRRA
ncbi:ABC transporter substrate-binding protein [Pseudoroseomonas globiformis]|uniref:ABC transporter substrate-binding protein n=1 Tax=Teichococcus globiformis TaxID=2307229 RepID=A0ABV7FVJ3_9PROT